MAIFRNFNPIDHDRAVEDRRRHRQLVEKSIKDNLGDILSGESIVGESKDKKIKIPIRGLKEYQFVYGKNVTGTGSGTGSEKRGDKIGTGKKGLGQGSAGDGEGEDIYETEVTIEEVLEYLLNDLELPDLDKKKYSEIWTDKSSKRAGYQRYGIRPRLAKKRTVAEKIKRKQGKKRLAKEAKVDLTLERFPFREEDLRFYRTKPSKKRESNAAIICIMDTSGSMDNTKKYLARSFFFVLSRFIRLKYSNVQIAFVSHSTVAKEVDENDFFHRGESGGTYISKGLTKAIEIIKTRYNPEHWNVYPFYVSDGDNWSEDDDRAVKAAKELCELSNLFGYAELMPGYYSTIKDKLTQEVKAKNFIAVTITHKKEMWDALRIMLKKSVKVG